MLQDKLRFELIGNSSNLIYCLIDKTEKGRLMSSCVLNKAEFAIAVIKYKFVYS